MQEMLPLILNCSDNTQRDAIITEFINKNSVLPHNIHRVQLEEKKKEISVSQIRSLLPLFHHQHTQLRIIIIEDYDTVSEEAQNALLKLLEEKTQNTQFFLLVTNVFKVLPTIRSRSHIHSVQQNDTGAVQVDGVDELANKILASDVTALSHPLVATLTSQKAIEICDTLLFSLRATLHKGGTATTGTMKEIMRIKQLIQENNLNPRLGIDALILAPKR